jgi:hypothetical protein
MPAVFVVCPFNITSVRDAGLAGQTGGTHILRAALCEMVTGAMAFRGKVLNDFQCPSGVTAVPARLIPIFKNQEGFFADKYMFNISPMPFSWRLGLLPVLFWCS